MKHMFLKVGVLMMGMLFLAGCLDDEKNSLDPSDSYNIIQFLDPSGPASPSGSVYPVYVNSYELTESVTYEIKISNAGPDDASNSDIELSLAADPVALDLYNTQQTDGLYGSTPLGGQTFDVMPEEYYDIPSSVTIPAGQKTVTIPITFYPQEFDFSKNYALPFRIVSASSGVLSEHWSVAILGIGVRNDYDGVYTYTGFVGRWNAAGVLLTDGLAGNVVPGVQMSLTTASSNTLQFLNSQGSQLPMWASGASGIAGIGTPLITVNPDNTITLSPIGATPSLWGPIPGQPNDYDPATRTFRINYKWDTSTDGSSQSPSSPTGTNRYAAALARYDREREYSWAAPGHQNLR